MKEYDDIREHHDETVLLKLKERLEKRELSAHIMRTAEEVRSYVLESIPAGSTVGIGGPVKGRCSDCKAPASVCRITTILDYRPVLTPYTAYCLINKCYREKSDFR